jgi:large subunit ribosomal protein L16
MFLQPKKLKYIKYQKIKKAKHFIINNLSFGKYGIQSIENGYLTAKQIESTRRVLTRFLKKDGKIWIRCFPNIPITKKPNETRIGKGKGSVNIWVVNVKPGQILFEISLQNDKKAKEILKSSAKKLPIKTKILKRNNIKKL